MYLSFIKLFFITFISIFMSIAIVNFIVDPGNVYLNKILVANKINLFSNQILNSKYGVLVDGINDRQIKVALAQQMLNYDCVILGSSHVVGISSARNTGNINDICKNVLNLGVDGGSLEDIAIFSYIIQNRYILPRKVFIGIDPWTIKYNMDDRFKINEYIYMKIKDKSKVNFNYNMYYKNLVFNLFNFEYLIFSIKKLINKVEVADENNFFDKKLISIKSKYDYKFGCMDGLVMLRDGSRVYKTSELLRYQNNLKTLSVGGDELYKISGNIYDDNALLFFKKIVIMMQKNNIEVNFIITPYHPKIFKKRNMTWEYINVINGLVYSLSKELNIKVYGSYYPDELDCKDDEFIDFMHAHTKCLNKINFNLNYGYL